MITKKELVETIEAMPEESFADLETVMERLILLEKIKRGLADAENGRLHSEEDVHQSLGL